MTYDNSNFDLSISSIVRRTHNSFTVKIIMIGIVILLCQIPILMVDGLISSRKVQARIVEDDIASKWGSRQLVTGPLLAVPLMRETIKIDKNGRKSSAKEYSTWIAVPQKLDIKGELTPEIRYRGIYEAVLYRSNILLKCNISFPDTPPPDDWQAQYEQSSLILGITDLKGITDIQADFNGRKISPVTGLCRNSPVESGLSIPLNGKNDGQLELSFKLNGCRDLFFTMAGRQTNMILSSPWNAPSFGGGFLPESRKISEQGFTASWSVSEFNRQLPAAWVGKEYVFREVDGDDNTRARAAGVGLIKVADAYLQVNRAVEYAVLIFIIVLMAMLTAEKLSRVWVHPLQYFIAALSLVLFYTLTLAISEHSTFAAAYWISAAAVTCMYGFYSLLIYRKAGAVVGMIMSVAAAYSVIYTILQLEDYALLAGSIILFILLTVLMFFTGRINRRYEETGEL